MATNALHLKFNSLTALGQVDTTLFCLNLDLSRRQIELYAVSLPTLSLYIYMQWFLAANWFCVFQEMNFERRE